MRSSFNFLIFNSQSVMDKQHFIFLVNKELNTAVTLKTHFAGAFPLNINSLSVPIPSYMFALLRGGSPAPTMPLLLTPRSHYRTHCDPPVKQLAHLCSRLCLVSPCLKTEHKARHTRKTMHAQRSMLHNMHSHVGFLFLFGS